MDKITLLESMVVIGKRQDGMKMAVISTENEYKMPAVVLFRGDRPEGEERRPDGLYAVLKFAQPDDWDFNEEALTKVGLKFEDS
jgi:hypothetical protein